MFISISISIHPVDTSHLTWYIAQPGVSVRKLQRGYTKAKLQLQLQQQPLNNSSPSQAQTQAQSRGAITVGFVGRLVPVKSPGIVLLVAQSIRHKYPGIRFLIVGGGNAPYLKSLKRLAQQLRVVDIVEFTGPVCMILYCIV